MANNISIKDGTLSDQILKTTDTGVHVTHHNIDTLPVGQQTMSASTPVVLASDQSAIPITDNGGSITVDMASLPSPDNIGISHKWKSVNITSQQAGFEIWSPASSKKINLTFLSVCSYNITSGRVFIWFGADADTTYSAGTDQLVWAGSFAPTTSSKPGVIMNFTLPIQGTADYNLYVTTDADVSLDIVCYGYEN